MILKFPESGSVVSRHFVFISETSIIRSAFWNTEGGHLNLCPDWDTVENKGAYYE